MGETILILVNGEVLANGNGPTIADQHQNAKCFADYLLPIIQSELNVAILHGNKPQVGFVLFRSELASHLLHSVPLDVCGADTQGATGYILSQEVMNVIAKNSLDRKVVCVLTQTRVDDTLPEEALPVSAIGPWYDRNRAEQFRQTRGWRMIEEIGRGYRRGVPAYLPVQILEIDIIRTMVAGGNIVIAGGGGGVPVVRAENGELHGIEAVIETEQLACLMAKELAAKTLLSVIENDQKFTRAGFGMEVVRHLSSNDLAEILVQDRLPSKSVGRILRAANDFLTSGGEKVIITTLRNLSRTLDMESGLWIMDSPGPLF